jgi:hypothetical protein
LYLYRPLTVILSIIIGFDISASKENSFLKFSAAEIINNFSPKAFVSTVLAFFEVAGYFEVAARETRLLLETAGVTLPGNER